MQRYKKIYRWLAVFILTLIPVSSALAYFASIDTNDGLVDSAWSGSPLISDASNDAFDSGYEIVSFWLVTDASTPANIYLRADLLSALDPDGYLAAELDCDSDLNSDYQIIYYPPGTAFDDFIRVVDVNSPITYDDYLSPTPLGEALGTSQYEWQAPVTGTNVDLSACLSSTFATRLATYLDDGFDFYESDITSFIELNTPTALTMADFAARQAQDPFAPIAGAALVVLAGVVLAFVFLRLAGPGKRRSM